MQKALVLWLAAMALAMQGCSTPSRHVERLRLGMSPDEVLDVMGRPFAVRASKLYSNEEWQEVWEYIPPVFSFAGFADRYDKDYWLYFENGRLVQWGQPLDLSGEVTAQSTSVPLAYSPEKED